MVLLPVPYRTAQFFAFFLTTTAAYALPRATPAPALTPGPHVAGPPGDPQILPCTATIGVTYSRLPTPPYWPWCTENGGVERVYEATRTVQQQVDCRGCLAVTVETFPAEASCEDEYSDYYSNDGEDDDGYYAARPKKRTEAAVGTKTIYETVCSPTTTPIKIQGRQEEPTPTPVVIGDEGAAQAPAVSTPCVSTLVVPEVWVGLTVTVFLDMMTVTSKVDCGGCALHLSTRVGGLGPIVQPGVTATVDVATTVVYECL